MFPVSLLEWIFTAAAVAASWGMYQAMEHHGGAGPEQRPAGVTPPALAPAVEHPGGTLLDETLRRIQRTGGFRDLGAFMTGARLAYEQIVEAYAAGRLDEVAPLLGPAVRTAFAEAIAARQARGETESLLFIGFASADPVAAGLDQGDAWIDVRFVAQLVAVTTDRNGGVVAGHPRRVVETTETWTFARETRSTDPNWLLVATEAQTETEA